jgi:hypothetical protein
MFITGVPLAARANHGAATVSTNVSATSLRHTNDDHSGNSLGPNPADHKPFRGDRDGTGNRARRQQHQPAAQRRPPDAEFLVSACSAPSTASPIATVTIIGSNRNVSTTARIAFNLSGGRR